MKQPQSPLAPTKGPKPAQPQPTPTAAPAQPQPLTATPQPVVLPLITRYVSFSAEINVQTTESLIALLAQYANEGVQVVYLMLSTPGGSVMHGLNLYNVLRGMPFKLITHNVGNVDSIGNAVFLAGEERYASPHATFMFHGVAFMSQAVGETYEEKILRERLGSVLADQKRIGSIIQERSQIGEADAAALFREAQTKDSAYAAGVGLVHEVKDVQIPAGSPVAAFVFKR
jgi:ATP-dependent Clp protease protease subunit